MKLLKPVVLGIFAITALSLNAQEDHKPHKDRTEKRVAHMTDYLDLNDEQSNNVEAARLDFINTAKKIKTDETTTQEVKKAQIKAERDRYNTVVKSILTEDQFEKFEVKSEEIAKKRQAHKDEKKTPEARAKHKANKLAAKLTDVTDEQRNNMEALFLKVAQKIEAVEGNPNLTDEQKKEFIKGNKNDSKNALKMILTDAQNTELEALRASHGSEHEGIKDTDVE